MIFGKRRWLGDAGLLLIVATLSVLISQHETEAICPSPVNGTECNGKGACVQNGDSDVCQCERGWGGEACSLTGCTDPNCGGHGTCQDPAVDPSVEGNMAYCLCDPEWEGKNCETPRGTCDPPCVADQGECERGVCKCAPGFDGPTCGDLACGDNGACSGHGSCDKASNHCMCSAGWSGKVCDEPKKECKDPTCGGNGYCESNIGECVCNKGFIGESCDKLACEDNCGFDEGRGQCVDDKCICNEGFTGLGCKSKDCPNKCSGHGECMVNAANPGIAGICICDPGYVGADCSKQPCSNNCNGHGKCNANKTGCICDPGFSGEECAECDGEYHCSHHGMCVWSDDTGVAPFTPQCECYAGFSTDDCSMAACPLGQSPVTSPVPTICSGRGDCMRNNETGQYSCECDEGFGTMDCHAKCPTGKNGKQCGGHGYCADNHPSTEPEYGSGLCVCDPEWAGSTCEEAQCDKSVPITGGRPRPCGGLAQGVCHKEKCYCRNGFSPPSCASKECPGQCSGHGVCDDVTNPDVPKCACDAGFGGEDCSEPACCSPTCNGHGECKSGRCHCEKGFFGSGCAEGGPEAAGLAIAQEERVCETKLRQCSGHGDCNELNVTCTCDEGFRGQFCEKKSCKKDCSGRGTCGDDGVCKCEEGYAGRFCQRKACPNNCNGRGYCIAGTCFCRAGWEGVGCAARSCPNDCSSMGVCKAGVCACLNGYSGEDCSVEPCPGWIGGQQCSGHGICKDAVCSCTGRHEDPFDEPMWIGDDCATKTCPSGIPGKASACSGHGMCDGNECKCKRGWRGIGCEIRTCGGCSGHGTCDESVPKHPVCQCTKGYAGDFCENLSCDWDIVKQVPKPGCHENLVPQRGICSPRGKCFCNTNYTGLYCEKPACKQCDALDKCLNRCNDNGVCKDGVCVCNAGFGGEDCGVRQDSAIIASNNESLLVELGSSSRRDSLSIHNMLAPDGRPCVHTCDTQCGIQRKIVEQGLENSISQMSCRWACLSRCQETQRHSSRPSMRPSSRSSLLQ